MWHETILELVGNTPHLRLEMQNISGCEMFMKLEGCNPTGSIKDRTCVYLLRDALERGALRPGATILDASSGNMASAMAFYGRLLDVPTEVVVNSKLTAGKKDFIEYFGAKLHMVGDFTIQGNNFCRTLATQNPERYCFLDQLHNWANPRAHYETTGKEILEDFPEIAVLVGSIGSGGSLLGTAQFLKGHVKGVKVLAVQAAAGTRLPGTASLDDGDYVTPFIHKGFADGWFDYTTKVSEADSVHGTLVLKEQGVYCGLQAGGILQGACSLIRKLGLKGQVILLSGDTGWKNMDKLLTYPDLRSSPLDTSKGLYHRAALLGLNARRSHTALSD